jgi:hypothetical protein
MKFKGILIAPLFTLMLFLVACGTDDNNYEDSNSDTNNTENTASTETSEETDAEINKVEDSTESDVVEESNESDDGLLTKPGETIKESEYTVELIKIKELNQTVEIAPLTLTLKDAKLIKYKDMAEGFKSEMEAFSNGPIGDEFTYLQITYNVENTEDKNIGWNGLSTVVTDQKEQIDVIMNDFLLDDTDTSSDFYGQVAKEAQVGLILKNPDINNVKLIFESTYDSTSYEDITAGQTVEISF